MMHVYTEQQPITTYSVGLCHDLRRFDRRLQVSASWAEHRKAFRRLAYDLKRGVWERARARRWRDLKNYFNGFLAEPYEMPETVKRCGSGWTRKRALRSLARHYEAAGLSMPQGVLDR